MGKQEAEFDVSINEHRLDKEWVNQPKKYYDCAIQLAEAKREVEECKNKIEVIKADLDKEIRSNPEEFDIAKITESVISATIVLQSEYRNAMKGLVTARYNASMIEAGVSALDHRKRALENLVSLQLANYYSEPKAQEGNEEAVDAMEKNAVRRRSSNSKKRRNEERENV